MILETTSIWNRWKPMKRKIKIITVVSFMVLAIMLVSACSYFENVRGLYRDEAAAEVTVIGDYENDFTLKDLDGQEISISDFSGDIVVLNFWATWCPPCRAEIPDFIEVYSDYRDKGVQFIGVSSEDERTLRGFVNDFGINYPILVDTSNIGGAWDIRAIPTTFILDRSGKILFKNVGMMTKSQLEAVIEDAL
jgi:cytochrome c biogenesis protein CcmG/thiol:disulfide interchange protein DsbE